MRQAVLPCALLLLLAAVGAATTHTTVRVPCQTDTRGVTLTTLSGVANGSSWAGWVQLAIKAGVVAPGTREYALRDGKHLPMNEVVNDTQIGRHVVEVYTFNGAFCDTGGVRKQTWTYTIVPMTRSEGGAAKAMLEQWGLPTHRPRPWTPLGDTILLSQGRAVLDVMLPQQAVASLLVPLTLTLRTLPTVTGGGFDDVTHNRLPLPSVLRLNCLADVNVAFTDAAGAQVANVTLHVPLRRGMGSIVMDVSTLADHDGLLTSTAVVCGVAVPTSGVGRRSVHLVPSPAAWDGSTELLQSDGIVVERGSTLTLTEGTTLLLAPGACIVCHDNASVVLQGSPERPVVVQGSRPQATWGGIVAHSGCLVRMRHAIVVGSGAGGPGDGYGHHRGRPLLRLHPASNANLVDSALLKGVGQAFGSEGAILRLHRVLVSGFVSGGQLDDTTATIYDSTFAEFPNADQVSRGDEDNDALYVVGGTTHALDSAFMFAKDDCLDSGSGVGGSLLIQHSYFEHCLHEGVALSNTDPGQVAGADSVPDGAAVEPKHVVVESSLFSACQQGLELGFSTSRLWAWAHNCVFSDNDVGVRYSDNYGWQTAGFLYVSASVFTGNGQDWLNMDASVAGGATAGHRLALWGCAFDGSTTPGMVRASNSFVWDAVAWVPSVVPATPLQWREALPGGALPGPRATWVAADGLYAYSPSAVQAADLVRRSGVSTTVDAALASEPLFPDDTPSPTLVRLCGEDTRWSVHRHCALVGCTCAMRHVTLAFAGPGEASQGVAPPPPEDGTEPPPASYTSCHNASVMYRPWAGDRVGGDKPWRGGDLYTGARSAAGGGRAVMPMAGGAPEDHVVVVWSGAGEDATADVVTALRSLRHVAPELSSLSVVAVRTVSMFDPPGEDTPHTDALTDVCPTTLHALTEAFFQAFYGDTYYLTAEDGGEFRGMALTKGTGAFTVVHVRDDAPLRAPRPGKGVVNANMYALKWLLRQFLPRPGSFMLHASQTAGEGVHDLGFLFGGGGAGAAWGPMYTPCNHTHFSLSRGAMVWSVPAAEVAIVLGRSDFAGFKVATELIVSPAQALMKDRRATVGEDPKEAEMVLLARQALWLNSNTLTLLLTLPRNMKWWATMSTMREVATLQPMPTEELSEAAPWGFTCRPVIDHARLRLYQLGVHVTANGTVSFVEAVGGDLRVIDRIRRLLPVLTTVDVTVVVIGKSPTSPQRTLWDGNHRSIAFIMVQLLCEFVLPLPTGLPWLQSAVGDDTAAAVAPMCGTLTPASPVRVVLGVSPDLVPAATCDTCAPLYCDGGKYAGPDGKFGLLV